MKLEISDNQIMHLIKGKLNRDILDDKLFKKAIRKETESVWNEWFLNKLNNDIKNFIVSKVDEKVYSKEREELELVEQTVVKYLQTHGLLGIIRKLSQNYVKRHETRTRIEMDKLKQQIKELQEWQRKQLDK